MTSKVQGEGDYESARRYDEKTKRFVEEKTKEGTPLEGSAAEASDELTPEEKEALSRAKSGSQDKRDADALREAEKRRKPGCGTTATRASLITASVVREAVLERRGARRLLSEEAERCAADHMAGRPHSASGADGR